MILALAGQFKQLSHEPEKFRWLNGIRTHNLCDAGAVLKPTELWSHTVESRSIRWAHVFPWKECHMKEIWHSFHGKTCSQFFHMTFLSQSFSYFIKKYDIPFTGKHEPNELTCSPLCDFIAQLVRALHRHRRGHGFESRWVTWIFQVHETIA